MARSEDIKPISELKSKSAALIKKVNHDKRPIIITQSGKARAVLIDIDDIVGQVSKGGEWARANVARFFSDLWLPFARYAPFYSTYAMTPAPLTQGNAPSRSLG